MRWSSCALTAALLILGCAAAEAGERATFRVADAIEMATFVDPFPSRQLWPPSEDFKFSPDGRYVAIVTQRGLLATNQGESTLWLFDVMAIKRFAAMQTANAPSPRALVHMTAPFAPNMEDSPTITELRWLPDGRLAFLGQDRSLKRHLYVVDVKTNTVHRLTPNLQDVGQYDIVGDAVAYTVMVDSAESVSNPMPAVVASGHSLFSLEFANEEGSDVEKFIEIWTLRSGKSTPVVDKKSGRRLRLPESASALFGSNVLALSPSLRFVVLTVHPKRIPKGWEAYEPFPSSSATRFKATPPGLEEDDNARYAQEYTLVDLSTGQFAPLFDAPLGLHLSYLCASARTLVRRRNQNSLGQYAASPCRLERDGEAKAHRGSMRCGVRIRKSVDRLRRARQTKRRGHSQLSKRGKFLLAD